MDINNTQNNMYESEEKPKIEKLEFKPNIKIEVIKIIIGLCVFISLLLFIIIPILIVTDTTAALVGIIPIITFIIFMGIMGTAGRIVTLLVTKYTISKDNEIIISQNLLSKASKVYRIDQITSIERTQGWLQKKFNLHSLKFNIFGLSPLSSQTGQQGYALLPVFNNIVKGDEVFKEVLSRMSVIPEEIQYQTRPKTTPQLFSIFLNLTFLLFTSIVTLFVATSLKSTSGLIVGLIVFSIVFLLFLGLCIDYLKLKKTNYCFYEDSAFLKYHYIFKNADHATPYRKITNVSRYRSLIRNLLFKVSNIKLYTGGNRDQLFSNVANNSTMFEIFSYLVKDKTNRLNKKIVSSIKSNQEKPIKILKPGVSYIVQPLISTIIYSSIFVVAIFVSIIYVNESSIKFFVLFGSIIGIIIGIIKLIITFIQWKNIKYELYKTKIVMTYGVLSIVSSEIYIANIKYVSLNIPFYLQRVFNEGTISIYTAGKSSRDGILRRVPNAKYYYKQLCEVISED